MSDATKETNIAVLKVALEALSHYVSPAYEWDITAKVDRAKSEIDMAIKKLEAK